MAAWRKQQDSTARHRRVKREADQTREAGTVQVKWNPQTTQNRDSLVVDYPKRANTSSRRTETSPVPGYVNTSCDAPLTVCSSLFFVVCVRIIYFV